jgi:NodT family efflux transporter outer membrane factor (OMF) lipoprotein
MSPQTARLSAHAAAIAVPLLLAACAVGPDYRRPTLSASAGYGGDATSPGTPAAAAAGAPQLMAGLDIPAQWWRVFHSPDLDALVAQALKSNPTVDAAKAALRSAREQVKAQRGAFYPSVTASLQPSHQYFAGTLASPALSGDSIYDLTTTQVSVAYAPDLFGANARAVESLVAQQDQQRFELEAARLTLASNVVLAAIQDAVLREQIATTRAIIADQQQTLASFRRQHQLGQVSTSDLAAQEALLAQTQAILPPLVKQFHVNRDLLSALVGRTPGEPLDVRFDLNALALPDRLPLSLPAQLVEHRPDVRIAEAQLHAASAQVGVATAARWPSLQIDAGGGSAALGLTPEFTRAANFWNVAATLTQPIFQGGALLHRQRVAEAAYDQAAAQYRSTVVGAFQNTADVLHALRTDADALGSAESSAAASRRSLDIAQRQFDLGDVSRLAVLGAEQTEAQARLALLQARANRYADVVALFQALGGGWWNDGAPGEASAPAAPKR